MRDVATQETNLFVSVASGSTLSFALLAIRRCLGENSLRRNLFRWMMLIAAVFLAVDSLELLTRALHPAAEESFFNRQPVIRFADIVDKDLRDLDLVRWQIHSSNLSGSELIGANLEWARLSNNKMNDMNLKNSVLRNIRVFRSDIRISNMQAADLSRAYLDAVDLTDSIMIEANLSQAVLDHVVFDRADLTTGQKSLAPPTTC